MLIYNFMQLTNFVPFPRKIASDVKSGKIASNEFTLYAWLRVHLNPWGVVSVSLKALKDDIFKEVSPNYINKLLLSLLSKKYIYYHRRQGRRGSFEVEMGEIVLPNKQIKTLDKYFNPNEVRSEAISLPRRQSEEHQTKDVSSQKLKAIKDQIKQDLSMDKKHPLVRSPYNDNETYILPIDKKTFKGIPVNTYIPTSSDYLRCQEIAVQLGEKDMDFILSVFHKHGLGIIDRAWGLYREQDEKEEIENPGGYFNRIIQQLLKTNEENRY